jgi:hypothetical protein
VSSTYKQVVVLELLDAESTKTPHCGLSDRSTILRRCYTVLPEFYIDISDRKTRPYSLREVLLTDSSDFHIVPPPSSHVSLHAPLLPFQAVDCSG